MCEPVQIFIHILSAKVMVYVITKNHMCLGMFNRENVNGNTKCFRETLCLALGNWQTHLLGSGALQACMKIVKCNCINIYIKKYVCNKYVFIDDNAGCVLTPDGCNTVVT